ncbi:hypothetical protein [Dyella sp.]|uniref:hypothetical protein n=1 Tax=Dyella sp. TaxID=1869338 RepID=UPI002B4A9958|nr:hypothetical protein [Dyella sp.]HKT27820.1 hypothetical protein [Dyella sp.]
MSDTTKHPTFQHLIVVLCLAWLALNLPLLIGKSVMPWDAMDEFYPIVYFNAHSLRLGLAPWWNPYIYSGYPQIADPQGMLFSPLLMAWMLLREAPGPVWFSWVYCCISLWAVLPCSRFYGETKSTPPAP